MSAKLIPSIKNCRACGSDLASSEKYELNGFVQDTLYLCTICSSCKTQQTSINSDHTTEALYNSIYANAQTISGYKRYSTYSWLSSNIITHSFFDIIHAEPAYMGAARLIQDLSIQKGESLRVLEIGCGLGYFTARLKKLGHAAIGFDLSKVVCQKAAEIHGDFFVAGNLDDLGEKYCGYFDAIVCLEVLEHLDTPEHYINSLRRMLKEGGSLVASVPLSTSPGIWDATEPPIHVTHFSSKGIFLLAQRLGARCEYVKVPYISKRQHVPSTLPGNVLTKELKPNLGYFDNGNINILLDAAPKLAKNLVFKYILRRYDRLKLSVLGEDLGINYAPTTFVFRLHF